MNIYVVIAVYCIFAVIEIISLIKSRRRKELVFFCIATSLAFAVSILIALGVQIPNVKKIIGDIVMSFAGN